MASVGGISAALGLAAPSLAVLLPIGGVLFLYGLTETIGRMAFPEEGRWTRWMFGLLGSAALISFIGTVVYHFYKLDGLAWSWILVTLPWAVFVFTPIAGAPRERPLSGGPTIEKTPPEDSLSAVLLVIAVAADLAALRWLVGARTGEALRSPWEAVPPIFFLWIVLSTFCLVALAYRKRYPHLTLVAASLHLLAILSPALAVYAVGYGFDPFVHQAAERLVAAAGEVTPKTPYYIGQYALVTFIARIFRLSVEAVDRALVPAMAALFLPAAGAWLLRRGFGVSKALALVASFGILLLPLAPFVSTTPQGLADLYFLLTMLLGAAWVHAHRPPLGYVLLVAGAAAATHPLAGVPALLAAAVFMAVKLRHDGVPAARVGKAAVYLLLVALAVLAVPLTFSVREGSGASLATALRKPVADLAVQIPFEAPGIESRYRPALDFAEFANRNRDFLLFLMAGAGIWLLGRKKPYRRTALAAGGLAAALCVSAGILKSGYSFQDVIGYEQANYAARLYEIGLLALAPLALAAFAWWWKGLSKTDASVRFTMTLLFAAVAGALAYGAFPRLDDYRWSRGYSASVHDLEAVRLIDRDATAPYVVLADQSVSAAALAEYGFRTYYGNQFYYSIPTGAPLYQHYLRMAYDGAPREEMDAVMREIGVPTSYFVINRYWTDSARVVEQAKKTADAWWSVDGGELHVFRYSVFGK